MDCQEVANVTAWRLLRRSPKVMLILPSLARGDRRARSLLAVALRLETWPCGKSGLFGPSLDLEIIAHCEADEKKRMIETRFCTITSA